MNTGCRSKLRSADHISKRLRQSIAPFGGRRGVHRSRCLRQLFPQVPAVPTSTLCPHKFPLFPQVPAIPTSCRCPHKLPPFPQVAKMLPRTEINHMNSYLYGIQPPQTSSLSQSYTSLRPSAPPHIPPPTPSQLIEQQQQQQQYGQPSLQLMSRAALQLPPPSFLQPPPPAPTPPAEPFFFGSLEGRTRR